MQPPGPPVDPTDSTIVVVANVVKWSTSEPRRGSVRYSYTFGNFDHMAYPVARNRRDKELRTRHEVPLLDLQPGRTLYYQVVNETGAGVRTVAPPDSILILDTLGRSLLTATMIHIGFGDSHLVTMPNGARLLIDGGERAAAASVAQYMAEHGITGVAAMLATHVHLDHMGGIGGFGSQDANALLRLASPAVYFDTPVKSSIQVRDIYRDVLAHITATPTQLVVVERGDTPFTVPELGLDPAVGIQVLNSGRLPAPPFGDRETDQINNDSMVLKFTYLDVDFIIGGDAEVEAEASMLAAFPGQLEVEYYKAQHHGLSDASSPAWVNALDPRVGFIPNTDQVWDGNFEGAIASTANSLRGIGAHVYVIDEAEALGVARGSRQYNVTFATDGLSYEVWIEWATQNTPGKLSVEALECMMRGHEPPGGEVSPDPEERP